MSEAVAEEKPKWPDEPARMTDDELRTFVLGLADRRIWTSEHGEHALDAFRIPMMFMGENPPPACYLESTGCCWEWLDKAGPLAIDGQPSFFSMRFMHVDDWERAQTAYAAEIERRKEIPLP